MTELMSNEADCRTAPATPGLLNMGAALSNMTYWFVKVELLNLLNSNPLPDSLSPNSF